MADGQLGRPSLSHSDCYKSILPHWLAFCWLAPVEVSGAKQLDGLATCERARYSWAASQSEWSARLVSHRRSRPASEPPTAPMLTLFIYSGKQTSKPGARNHCHLFVRHSQDQHQCCCSFSIGIDCGLAFNFPLPVALL